jgi:hypothetical protein
MTDLLQREQNITNCIRDCMGPTVSFDIIEKTKIPACCKSKPNCLAQGSRTICKSEIYEILLKAFHDDAMSRAQILQWHASFKSSQTPFKEFEHPVCPIIKSD